MLKKLFFDRADRGIVQLIRYGLVVAIAAPIDFGGYVLLATKYDMDYVLASVISFTASLIVNYFLCIKWIWTEHSNRQKHVDAMMFFLIGLVGLALTAFLVWIFTSVANLNYIVAKLVTFMIVFVWSFGSRRYLFTGRLLKRKIETA
jgi:putative flippase GtrA